MSTANLILDSYQVYAGNIVRGKAICSFRSDKEIRKIRIRLKGEESTYWTETESYYDSQDKRHKTRTVHYSGNNSFICRDILVYGEGTLGRGEHAFPFEFTLSENIPDTFQHNYGRIKYSVTVTVDRPWKIDYECEREFTVYSPIKLQMMSSHLLEPAEFSDEKTVCCFCCASGPIQLDVNLEKRAFVVGESAGIKIYCLNMSNANVESLGAQITMEVRFKATHPKTDYKYDSENVASSFTSGVGAHGEKTFNLRLEIPPSTVVPNFAGCELFNFSTNLKVSGVISGCHTDLDISTGVALGHIPRLEALPRTAPPEQLSGILPMPMPMPLPGYEAIADKAVGLPPYPAPAYSPGPSAPQEIGAPSAPSKVVLATDTADFGVGNPSSYELPPPTYDEAAKNFQ